MTDVVTAPTLSHQPSATFDSAKQAIRALLTAKHADANGLHPAIQTHTVAMQLIATIVDTLDELDPAPDGWPAADRRSAQCFSIATDLIGETMRRHVIGAHHDGQRPAVAARRIRDGFLTACHLYADEYTQEAL